VELLSNFLFKEHDCVNSFGMNSYFLLLRETRSVIHLADCFETSFKKYFTHNRTVFELVHKQNQQHKT